MIMCFVITFDSILILQWISYLLVRIVLTVSYTILPSSWILDVTFFAEYTGTYIW